MKKTQREIYQTLANEIAFAMCAFCKFLKTDGGFSPCDCNEPYCTHPLLEKSLAFERQEEQAANLGDCWGFRPSHDISFCADVVGCILSNKWDEAVWWQNKKGQWKIAGIDNQ